VQVWFLAGNGGHWLMFLIRSLKANTLEDLPKNTMNFHQRGASGGRDVWATHVVADAHVFFNADALFNVYLNLMKKAKDVIDGVPFEQLSITDQFEAMASAASTTLQNVHAVTDINFNDIFSNREKFIDDLFSSLDNHQVVYHKNRNIAHRALDAYIATCVDPRDYFNNIENSWWLGWCLGIDKHLKKNWPLIYSMNQAVEYVKSNQEFYVDFTTNKVIFFNDK
jgi:hypothetical protein